MTSWKVALAIGAVATVMAASRNASATSSEAVCYSSPTATICLGWNGPFESACSSIFGFADLHMPLFLGLEKEAALRGRRFSVHVGACVPELSIDGNSVELAGKHDPSEFVQIIADRLGCETVPRYIVPAFSIQLEMLPSGTDAKPQVVAWKERLPDIEEDRGLISHGGDCDLQPFWTHTYPQGSTGIRYGVFATFAAARRGISELQLETREVQIVRTELRADSLEVYFGK